MSIDVTDMLKPLSEEAPCGVELEEFAYEPGFQALKKLLEGEPERQMGDVVVAAKEPGWREINQSALELWQKAKSVRLIYAMSLASLRRRGLVGLREQLELLQGLFDQYWDQAEPLLIEDGEYDAIMRINVLKEFNSRTLRAALMSCKLVSAPQAGTYTIADYFNAEKAEQAPPSQPEESGSRRSRRSSRRGEEEKAPEPTGPTLGIIRAALQECDVEQLSTTVEHLETIYDRLKLIEQQVNDQISEYSLEFTVIREILDKVVGPVTEIFQRRVPTATKTQGDDPLQGGDGGQVEGAERGTDDQLHRREGVPMQVGEITTREQALKLLDSVTDYFQRYEPTSPVPLFLQRAKRLAGQDFLSILKDLAPSGVDQVELISGMKEPVE